MKKIVLAAVLAVMALLLTMSFAMAQDTPEIAYPVTMYAEVVDAQKDHPFYELYAASGMLETGDTVTRYIMPWSSETMVMDTIPKGAVVEVVGEADFESSVPFRVRYNGREGFVDTLYLSCERVIEENVSYAITRGTYTVGTDIPVGLYSFYAPETGEGSLRVQKGAAFDWTRKPQNGAHHTVYLAEGATVTIGDGTLREMNLFGISGSKDIVPAGNRYLVGALLPPDDRYIISLVPGAESGYFVISSFEADIGQGTEERVDLRPGETRIVELTSAEFIELVNCTLHATEEGNG